MSLVGAVSLTNNTGVFLGSVNLDNLNINPNQLVYTSDGINLEGLNISSGLSKVLDDLQTVGNPDIQLVSNSVYVNDNVGATPIQTAIDNVSQADVIYISSGSYGENQISITDKYNIALQCPDVGNTITEILNGISITGTSELIRVSNLQIKPSSLSSSIIKGVGRHYFKNIVFAGSASQTHTIEIGKSTTKYMTFMNCEFDNYCSIQISSQLGAPIYFINCNFGGATINYGNTSPLLVIISNSSGLVAYPTSLQATMVGLCVLTSGASNTNTTTINGSTLVSIASQANTRIPIETSTSNSLTSSANLTFNTSTNLLTATNISGTNLTITNINGSSYPPASSGLSANNQSNTRIPYCTSTNNTLNCEAGFEYNETTNRLIVSGIDTTDISGTNLTITNINGSSYPPASSGVVVNNQTEGSIPFCTATANTLDCGQDLMWFPTQKLLSTNFGKTDCNELTHLQYITIQDGSQSQNNTNKVLTSDGYNGMKWDENGGSYSVLTEHFKYGQQTVQSGSSITLYSITGLYNKLPNFNCLYVCAFNFSVSSNNCILTLTLDDTVNTPQVYTQSLTNNGHHSIPITFIMPATQGYDFNFTITGAVDNGTISTDANDFYNIRIDQIKGML